MDMVNLEDDVEPCLVEDIDNDKEVTKNKVNMKEDEVPTVGMVFFTSEEAYDFYNQYAMQLGFGIKKRGSRTKDDKPFEFIFACSKEGKPNFVADLTSQRQKLSAKTQCQAKIILRFREDELLHLEYVFLEHNHLCSPSKARFFKSHKKLTLHVKKQLEYNDKAGVPPVKSFQTLVARGGGYENLPFNEKDCRNYIEKVRRLTLKEGDAQAVRDWFIRQQQENPRLFYVMDLDNEGHLRSLFWANTRSRDSYPYFHDVISFDTTYLTNKYNMPFAPFVGINHHGSSILLGAGLLVDESIETYIWLFSTWLKCMGRLAPKAIITDQCKAIGNAVLEVFSNARHRLCIWHIMKKISEKLSGYTEYETIKERVKDIVYKLLRIDEFEEQWREMIKEFSLEDNRWLKSLYDDRHRWVPTFVKDTFWAGMSSTQRSESMNAYFDNYVTSKSNLCQFVLAYDIALKAKYEKETFEDFNSWDKSPPLISRLPLEEHLSKVYTINVFKRFQGELQKSMDCTVKLIKVEGSLSTYVVREHIKHKCLLYEVVYNEDEDKVECICREFEFRGILCSHAIVVLKEKDVQKIPSKYIVDRWRKNFKRDYNTPSLSTNVLKEKPMERYDILYTKFMQLLPEMAEIGAIFVLTLL